MLEQDFSSCNVKTPGDLVKMEILNQQVSGRTWESVPLTSSQMLSGCCSRQEKVVSSNLGPRSCPPCPPGPRAASSPGQSKGQPCPGLPRPAAQPHSWQPRGWAPRCHCQYSSSHGRSRPWGKGLRGREGGLGN